MGIAAVDAPDDNMVRPCGSLGCRWGSLVGLWLLALILVGNASYVVSKHVNM
jgi:hypothetical protein